MACYRSRCVCESYSSNYVFSLHGIHLNTKTQFSCISKFKLSRIRWPQQSPIPCFILQLLQFSSEAQLCLTLCDPMNHSTPGLPVHHQLPDFTQTHIHRVGDAIQPSSVVPFSSCPQSLPASGSFPVSHQVAKVLEFQPQHQSFQ